MKKLLIGLLALGSLSVFSAELNLSSGEVKTIDELVSSGVESVTCQRDELPKCKITQSGYSSYVQYEGIYKVKHGSMESAIRTLKEYRELQLCR